MHEYLALPALAAELGNSPARELLDAFAERLKLEEEDAA